MMTKAFLPLALALLLNFAGQSNGQFKNFFDTNSFLSGYLPTFGNSAGGGSGNRISDWTRNIGGLPDWGGNFGNNNWDNNVPNVPNRPSWNSNQNSNLNPNQNQNQNPNQYQNQNQNQIQDQYQDPNQQEQNPTPNVIPNTPRWGIAASVPSNIPSYANPNNIPNLGKSMDQGSNPSLAPQPSIPLQPNFTAAGYTGLWYELYRTKNIPWEYGTDSIVNFTLNDDASLRAFQREWVVGQNSWRLFSVLGRVTDNRAHFTVRITQTAGPSTSTDAVMTDYRILYTDYWNIAVVLAVEKDANGERFWPFQQSVKRGWILGRALTIPKSLTDFAFSLFAQQSVKFEDFNKTSHGVAPPTPIPQLI